MIQLTDVTEFRTAAVTVDQAMRKVHISADDYVTTASEWRQVLRYLTERFGSVSLSDEFEHIPGTTRFVAVGTF
jgi:hypothetical protein